MLLFTSRSGYLDPMYNLLLGVYHVYFFDTVHNRLNFCMALWSEIINHTTHFPCDHIGFVI